VHGKADRHMKLLTLERESSLGSLWDQEQCAQFCSKDELWEAAKEEESSVITGPFINFLLHNHFITEFFFKKNPAM
jgi:hypothetical protein